MSDIIGNINDMFNACFEKSHSFVQANKTNDIDSGAVNMITRQIPNEILRLIDGGKYIVKGSVGVGRATKTPWIAILNKSITKTTREGVYVVYLFSSDYKRVYLTLNQGTTVPGQFGPRLKKKDIIINSNEIRKELNISNELLRTDGKADIADERYLAGAIFYTLWNVNDNSSCERVLKLYLDIYDRYYAIKTAKDNATAKIQDNNFTKNHNSYNSYLSLYRSELPSFWQDEKYKWEAVKQFQEKWDIEAEDFGAMFTEATSKQENLLASNRYYPIGMILGFASFDKERTREMFRVLFDESRGLAERIKFFSDEAEDIRKRGDERWINHYQDLRAISVYLTLMYPEKYFIYKYRELKKCVETFGDDFKFNSKSNPEFYSKVVNYCERLRQQIADDRALCDVFDGLISNDDGCYLDKHRNIATVDFIYYVGKRMKDDIEDKPSNEGDGTIIEPNVSSRYWIYAPGEGASMWDLCQDKDVMVLGWGEMGDYRDFPSRERLVVEMQATYNLHDKNFMNSSLAIWQFLKDMKPGDVVYVKQGRGKILGRGVVQGNYDYDEEFDEEYRNLRRIKWTHTGEWEAPFGLPMKTLTRLDENDTESVFLLEQLFFPEMKPEIDPVPFSIKALIEQINETGLIYTPELIKRFAFSLMTKPFVILSGLAGSGKTQLAITFAKALVEDCGKQLCTVSVGADWTNREPLLGFPNALQHNQYVRPESRVLDLLIEANKPENKNKPYFLILDEMNMSYVERYFADFLSAMESKEAIPLWNGCPEPENEDDDWDDTPVCVRLPKNLFIIGTINVDETTYMFSPKVLDRANVIEFKISSDEMAKFLTEMRDIDRDSITSKAANMGASFVEKASRNDLAQNEEAKKTLTKFFEELKKVNAEFGYRSATEIFRFICQAEENDDTDQKMTIEHVLDAAIVQKLLPKLHGSRKKLEPVLQQLWKLCFTEKDSDIKVIMASDINKAVYKESADKIFRMYDSACANGFTSFAEA